MAGILFTDGKLVLAGFNHHRFCITGIGGKKKDNETPVQTAVREMLEELFELDGVPDSLKKTIMNVLTFDNVMSNQTYTVFIMNFNDLQRVCREVFATNCPSKVYDEIPLTISDLLLKRKILRDSEFSHLSLLPCVYNISLDQNLLSDIYFFKNCENYFH
jgi:hypothetical protein